MCNRGRLQWLRLVLLLLQAGNKLFVMRLQSLDLPLEGQLDGLHRSSILCYQRGLILAEPQSRILELLNGLIVKVSILLPELQQPSDLLLLLFLHSQEAGAVDGNHNFLQRRQQILLLFPLAVMENVIG